MTGLMDQITAHPVGDVLAVLYILTAAVGTMPAPGSPEPIGTLLYKWFFDFIHTLLNQVEKLAASRYPQVKLPVSGEIINSANPINLKKEN